MMGSLRRAALLCFEKSLRCRWKIAFAESCSGGKATAALVALPGVSSVLEGGLVVYSHEAKKALLGVSEETLREHGSVSQQVAKEMVRGVFQVLPSICLAVSVTGVAGPGGTEGKPEGFVCFACAFQGKLWSQKIKLLLQKEGGIDLFISYDPGNNLHRISFSRNFGRLGRKKIQTASAKQALDLVGIVSESLMLDQSLPSPT